jgi:hypothetical protein
VLDVTDGIGLFSSPIFNVNVNISYYWVTVSNSREGKKVRIVHPDSYLVYAETLNFMENRCKLSAKTGGAGAFWREYYNFKNYFAEFKYNSCLTAHKSQGSTYQKVAVVYDDMDKCGNLDERNRLIYTACSRPSKLLVIYKK